MGYRKSAIVTGTSPSEIRKQQSPTKTSTRRARRLIACRGMVLMDKAWKNMQLPDIPFGSPKVSVTVLDAGKPSLCRLICVGVTQFLTALSPHRATPVFDTDLVPS